MASTEFHELKDLCLDDTSDLHSMIVESMCSTASHIKFAWRNPDFRRLKFNVWAQRTLDYCKIHPVKYRSILLTSKISQNKEIVYYGHSQIDDNTKSNDINNTSSSNKTVTLIDVLKFLYQFSWQMGFKFGIFETFRSQSFWWLTKMSQFLTIIPQSIGKHHQIKMFTINIKYQKLGYGTKLLNYTLDQLDDKYPIVINTYPSAVKFWLKNGFVIVGERKLTLFNDTSVDYCMIYHKNDQRKKELEKQMQQIWNENMADNIVFPSMNKETAYIVVIITFAMFLLIVSIILTVRLIL